MSAPISYTYRIDGGNFMSAGEASAGVKKILRQLGLHGELIRRVAISMYEGEINMVIHARGGTAEVEIHDDRILITLRDQGPGIPDIELAMSQGYSTASDQIRNLGFGAGMGLPNIKKYTDDLLIETELGVGTTLRMTFLL